MSTSSWLRHPFVGAMSGICWIVLLIFLNLAFTAQVGVDLQQRAPASAAAAVCPLGVERQSTPRSAATAAALEGAHAPQQMTAPPCTNAADLQCFLRVLMSAKVHVSIGAPAFAAAPLATSLMWPPGSTSTASLARRSALAGLCR